MVDIATYDKACVDEAWSLDFMTPISSILERKGEVEGRWLLFLPTTISLNELVFHVSNIKMGKNMLDGVQQIRICIAAMSIFVIIDIYFKASSIAIGFNFFFLLYDNKEFALLINLTRLIYARPRKLTWS